ncbi:MAG: type I restriction-modification system subunit M N-terminal domain-containing protein [Kiritimatiellae bacterium]|nr:type I restriction-modification system subunit M N-terminal domain-containing protein [Kiritimatiellia bacterium]MBP5788305.1 type I restriction-modification system subunit M N-terminal domain-containing protein [Kiritimatiellia bacterium]
MARKRTIEQSAAKLGFEQELLAAAEEMWGHISAAEYRQVLTGLIFLRYVSAAFDRRYEELKKEGLEEYRDGYAEENVFFIPPESRWGVIASAARKTGTERRREKRCEDERDNRNDGTGGIEETTRNGRSVDGAQKWWKEEVFACGRGGGWGE